MGQLAYHPHDEIVPTETTKNKGVSLSLESSPRRGRPPARAARRAPLVDRRPGPSSQSAHSPSAAQHKVFLLDHLTWTFLLLQCRFLRSARVLARRLSRVGPQIRALRAPVLDQLREAGLALCVPSFVMLLVVSRTVRFKHKAELCRTQPARHQPLARRSRTLRDAIILKLGCFAEERTHMFVGGGQVRRRRGAVQAGHAQVQRPRVQPPLQLLDELLVDGILYVSPIFPGYALF